MNKHNLEYFMEVYHQRNIQAAADNLFISHQGLSRTLRSLEEELGQTLFKRTNRGVVPTDFAIGLVPHVETILDSYNRISSMQSRAAISESSVVVYAFSRIGADPRPYGSVRASLCREARRSADYTPESESKDRYCSCAATASPVANEFTSSNS